MVKYKGGFKKLLIRSKGLGSSLLHKIKQTHHEADFFHFSTGLYFSYKSVEISIF